MIKNNCNKKYRIKEMKVKLLKKARKRFTITYYPLGTELINQKYKYNLKDKENRFIDSWFTNKDDVFESIIKILKIDYFKYSRKYKKRKLIKF